MDILVTGFLPFPGVHVNPTTALARAVATRLRRAGLDARALVLETSYSGGLPTLRRHLAGERPKAVLMLGLAARARNVRVERFARGRASLLHPDSTGGTPGAKPAASSRSLPMRASGDVDTALAALRRAGIRSRLSPSAGRYLCDASYAEALAWSAKTGAPAIFIHVPWLRPAAGSRPVHRVAGFRPGIAALSAALAAVGRDLARRSR